MIGKGKLSWMFFGSLILLSVSTPDVFPLFFLSNWPPASYPTSYPSRCLTDWDISSWRLGRWRSCLHARTQTYKYTQSQTWKCDRLFWVSKLLHSVAPWKFASLKQRQVLRLSCHSETLQLFHPSQQKWMDLAFLFILSNVNLSFG